MRFLEGTHNHSKKFVEGFDSRCWESSFKIDIPEFHGGLHGDDFLDWLHIVEEIFDFKDVSDERCIPLLATRFR